MAIWATPPRTKPNAMAMIGSNPARGMSGTNTQALAITQTLSIAGETAGVKNRWSELSIPMHAAAMATRVRKGSMTRVSWTVSSNFPGTAPKSPANSRVRGTTKIMPARTRPPVITIRALINWLPSCQAESRPSVAKRFVKVGTNAALITPSAKRSRIRFGMR